MGRYGPDQFNLALVIASFILSLFGTLTGWGLLSLLAWLGMVFCLFRFLSRNLEKRRSENDWFIRWFWPIRTKLLNRWTELKTMREYKYFSCPACKTRLRVPRGKGKVRVTCRKCGERFERKT